MRLNESEYSRCDVMCWIGATATAERVVLTAKSESVWPSDLQGLTTRPGPHSLQLHCNNYRNGYIVQHVLMLLRSGWLMCVWLKFHVFLYINYW